MAIKQMSCFVPENEAMESFEVLDPALGKRCVEIISLRNVTGDEMKSSLAIARDMLLDGLPKEMIEMFLLSELDGVYPLIRALIHSNFNVGGERERLYDNRTGNRNHKSHAVYSNL